MSSTHTTRQKIKTGNQSPHTHHQQQKILTLTSPNKLLKIYTQFTKITKMSSRLSSTAPLHINEK